MTRGMYALSLGAAVLLGMSGCKHKCCRSGNSLPPPAPFLPPGPGATIPPAGVPITPSAGVLPPADVRPSTSGRPAPEILLPDPIGPGGTSSQPKSNGGILGGPVAGASSSGSALEPPVSAKKPDAGSPQAGLPGFTQIADGFAAGRKPTLDGFDSLKKDGYKTVLFLHAPGADIAAVREVVEARGLNFVPVETTPDKLGDAFEQVKKTTAEKSARPAYSFDDDGTRAAAVLYLHFKTVELESADVARIRAKSLGLADDSDFWPAIKQYLSK